jgi:hypothetical protein
MLHRFGASLSMGLVWFQAELLGALSNVPATVNRRPFSAASYAALDLAGCKV